MTIQGMCKDCIYREKPDTYWGDCLNPDFIESLGIYIEVSPKYYEEGKFTGIETNKDFGCIYHKPKEGEEG